MLRLNFHNTKTHLFLRKEDQVFASWMPNPHHKWSNSNILGMMMSLHALSQFDPLHRETIYLWAAMCEKHYVSGCVQRTLHLWAPIYKNGICMAGYNAKTGYGPQRPSRHGGFTKVSVHSRINWILGLCHSALKNKRATQLTSRKIKSFELERSVALERRNG